MGKPLVTDDLWAAIKPLLPPEPPKSKGGQPRCDDRAALGGIIFVLRSGIPWEMLPGELGCSGMTCWRRLRDWHQAGAWAGLHRVPLERLPDAGHLDWSRASLDSAAVAAKTYGPPRRQVVCGCWAGSLQKRFRPPGRWPGPRWRSARSGSLKGAGLEGHFVPKGSRMPVDCWAIFLSCHPQTS